MQVFKFGGASVKDAESVRNVGRILAKYNSDNILVVVSAMGKITNLLEELVSAYVDGAETLDQMRRLKSFHREIISELIGENSDTFYEVENLFVELECTLDKDLSAQPFDYVYDQIVPFGELISTRIISHFLNQIGVKNRWLDARNFVITTSKHRRASVLWDTTCDLIANRAQRLIEKQLTITQGFIGRSKDNATTTLGREGSDYSAAIFAYGLNADSVTIWKDVPGVMNGDPKIVLNAQLMPQISFKEAIELAYYGASVIHPKTIQPLMRKGIPLYVKSFVNDDQPGTKVLDLGEHSAIDLPCYIFKENQVLISLSSKDFSFIVEDNLSHIFNAFANAGLQINLMQNTAISFSVCVNNDERRISKLLDLVREAYEISVDQNLSLLTVFNASALKGYKEYTLGKQLVLEQKSGKAIHFVLKPDHE
ncbi:MAG: aspartate kinase [Bacteroidia bacterium]|jgi:aspartate kinase